MEQYRNFFKEKPPQISLLLKCGSWIQSQITFQRLDQNL